MQAAPPAARTPGYHGAYLRVDLSRARGELEPLEERVLRGFLGGSGLGRRLRRGGQGERL